MCQPRQVGVEHVELFDETRDHEDHQCDNHADGERSEQRGIDERGLDLLAQAPRVLEIDGEAFHHFALTARHFASCHDGLE